MSKWCVKVAQDTQNVHFNLCKCARFRGPILKKKLLNHLLSVLMHLKYNILGSNAAIMARNFQLPLCSQDAVQREGCVLPGPLPRCHGERCEWNNNAHVTAAIVPSFRSVPKGSLGPCARPSGQIMGGERSGQLGAKERRLQEWILEPALRPRCPPSTCLLGKLLRWMYPQWHARFPPQISKQESRT